MRTANIACSLASVVKMDRRRESKVWRTGAVARHAFNVSKFCCSDGPRTQGTCGYGAQAGQRRGDVCVTVYKPAIIIAKPDEAAQVDIGIWNGPIPDRFNLSRIECHPGRRDPMAKETQIAAPSAQTCTLRP